MQKKHKKKKNKIDCKKKEKEKEKEVGWVRVALDGTVEWVKEREMGVGVGVGVGVLWSPKGGIGILGPV